VIIRSGAKNLATPLPVRVTVKQVPAYSEFVAIRIRPPCRSSVLSPYLCYISYDAFCIGSTGRTPVYTDKSIRIKCRGNRMRNTCDLCDIDVEVRVNHKKHNNSGYWRICNSVV
jgi:hypothetical protein